MTVALGRRKDQSERCSGPSRNRVVLLKKFLDDQSSMLLWKNVLTNFDRNQLEEDISFQIVSSEAESKRSEILPNQNMWIGCLP